MPDAIILKPASAAPLRLRVVASTPIQIRATAPDAPSIRLVSALTDGVTPSQAEIIAEDAATRERGDPLSLVSALLNTGI